jgi:polygalacturonase
MQSKWLSLLLLTIFGCNLHKENRITSYGAVADGTTNNARFIQQAIDEISAAGGGQLIVPPGNFMTSTVWLKSGVDLHLEPGATLLGPTNRNDYPEQGRPAIVMGKNQKNISVLPFRKTKPIILNSPCGGSCPPGAFTSAMQKESK